ncbi:Protein CBG23805 [Caenorhabditis briggsae]|uniref:Protein CBG23805 n=1 Tax=Caenorhabditis briggsae TaxID=6238 RepID=A8WJB9_CAEBR|nr:Protein CBG23805 [Caenorhabditis briggsae]CAP20562.2 Protein CBG23805 [Caenorhabditis briggsae]
MVPWKESTVITSSKTGREKWIEALGEGFRNQLEKVGTRRAYICRFHFPSGEVHGRRSVYSLPRLAADGDVADTSNLDFSEGDNGFEIIEDSRVADNEESFVLLNTDGEEDGEDSEESYGEQETDSSFVPEREESWSDDSEVEEDETSGNLEYAFVDLNCLIDSLKYCRQCHSEAVEAAVVKPSGYAVSISFNCLSCNHDWKWSSSRIIEGSKEYVVNRDLVSAAVSTGSSYSKIASMLHTVRAPYLRKYCYYDIVQHHVRPVVQNVHDGTQKKVMDFVIKNCEDNQKGLDLAGDAQFDSPGHMAEHSRYALLDVSTNFVLETKLLKKSSRTGNLVFRVSLQINRFVFTKFRKCEHDPMNHTRNDYIDVNNPKHEKALRLLWNMIVSDKRLKDLEKVSPHFNTSEVESFYSLSTIYHPKSYYFHKNFPLRVQLTVLHWNSLKIEWYNNERHYTGLKAFYNKSNKEAVFKKRKSSGSHSWRRVVLEGVRSHQTQASTHNVPLSVSPDPNHMTDDYSSPNNYSSSDDDMI